LGLLKLFNGGLGLSLMTPGWNSYWQKRELLADRFAFDCGQADGLIEFLDVYQFFDVAVPFHAFRSDHPYSETRIDRLRDFLEGEADAPVEPIRVEPLRVERTLAQEIAATNWDRKQGYTDEEAFLDLVVTDEGHAGWGSSEQKSAEKAWFRANGRRLTDLATWGNARAGRGYLIVMWFSWNAEERMPKTTYNTSADFVATRNDTRPRLGQRADELDWGYWEKRIATYDPDKAFIVTVGRLSTDVEMEIGVSYYQVEMAGGGNLPPWA